tara:strand:- start:298 stop:552 length:255 start_codon:yes stop_codon:yes gene_type:complete
MQVNIIWEQVQEDQHQAHPEVRLVGIVVKVVMNMGVTVALITLLEVTELLAERIVAVAVEAATVLKEVMEETRQALMEALLGEE